MKRLPFLRWLPALLITMEFASMREQSRVHSGSGSGSAFGLRASHAADDAPSRHPSVAVSLRTNYTSSDGRTSGSSSAPSVLSVGRSSTVTAGLEGVSGGDGGSSRGTATGPGEISHVATL